MFTGHIFLKNDLLKMAKLFYKIILPWDVVLTLSPGREGKMKKLLVGHKSAYFNDNSPFARGTALYDPELKIYSHFSFLPPKPKTFFKNK